MQKMRAMNAKAGREGKRKNNRKDRTKRGNWRKSPEGRIKGEKGGVCRLGLAGQGGAGAGEEQQDLMPPAQEGVEGKTLRVLHLDQGMTDSVPAGHLSGPLFDDKVIPPSAIHY